VIRIAAARRAARPASHSSHETTRGSLGTHPDCDIEEDEFMQPSIYPEFFRSPSISSMTCSARIAASLASSDFTFQHSENGVCEQERACFAPVQVPESQETPAICRFS